MTRAFRYPAIAAGGVVGATIRWAIAEVASTGGFPWATFLVNVVGAALLAAVSVSALGPTIGTALGTGFCGGLTTFSTFSLEIVELVDDGRTAVAIAYGPSSVLAAYVAFMATKRLGERER